MLESLSQHYWNLVANSPDIVAAASVFLALLTSVIMLAMTTLRKPEWFNESSEELKNIEIVRERWSWYSKTSFVTSFVFSVVSVVFAWVSNLVFFAPFIATPLAAVTFLAVFSLLTDPNLRLVDRHILRVGMVVSLLSSFVCALFTNQGDLKALIGFLILLVVIGLVAMLPVMGASDSRAIVIVFLSLVNVLFTTGLMVSWFASLVIAFVYALKKNNWNIKKSLFTKVSLPLVPMLLFPAATLLIFAAPLIKTGLFF